MSNIATKSRDLTKIKYRKFKFLGFAALKKFLKNLRDTKNQNIRQIVVYPEFTEKRELTKFLNKLLWYFPKNQYSEHKLTLYVSKISNSTEELLKNNEFKNQGNFYKRNQNLENIELINGDVTKKSLRKSDLILAKEVNNHTFFALLNYLNKALIVDEEFFSTKESGNFSKALDKTLKGKVKERLLEISGNNFAKLKKKEKKKSYVFCTGPSVEEAYDFDFSDGFNVICNSMVKNEEMLDHIQPDLLTFADPVFHFGPSKYAVTFREKMINAVKNYDLFVAVPEDKAVLLLSHYPELEERIILTKSIPRDREFSFPEDGDIKVRGTGNILTLYMLPFASSLSDEVYLLGCDGRKENEDYFWEHNSNVQFEGLKETAFKTHPSFFRDRVYKDYYEKHCETLEELLQFGEKNGKEYYTLTESYIPALKKRYQNKR